MNSHNRGLRDLAFVAVLMAVPIASYFFVFAPRNDEIAKARAEISAKNVRLENLRRLTSRIGDLGREIVEREEELERLNQKLPDREGVDRILDADAGVGLGERRRRESHEPDPAMRGQHGL